MTNKLKWRLGKLPTSEEVLRLINDKVITKEEGRQILFSEENEEDIKTDDLKTEIKFLRELVEKLSTKTRIVETIREIQKPFYEYRWIQPYMSYGNSVYVGTGGTSISSGATSLAGNVGANSIVLTRGSISGNGALKLSATDASFTDIQTF